MEENISELIVKYAHRMDARGWVANHDGNISVRTDEKTFLCTPTARAKIDISTADLVEVDENGKKTSGKAGIFSEIAVHMAIYKTRKDVNAVVHAHCPHAMSVGCSNQEMLTWAVPEAVISLGPGIPLVSLALPNAPEVISEMETLAGFYDAAMVAGNGVFAWGPTLEIAYLRLELVEHLAKIFLKAQALGGPQLLNSSQAAELLKRREKAGLALPSDPSRPNWFPRE